MKSLLLTSVIALSLGFTACGSSNPDTTAQVDINTRAIELGFDTSLQWAPGNLEKLVEMVEKYGVDFNPNYNANDKPLAVFDNDNTLIKNDIGDGTTFYMLNNNLIQNPGTNFIAWSSFDPRLTLEAAYALEAACDKPDLIQSRQIPELDNLEKEILLTNGSLEAERCGQEILSIYYDNVTTDNNDLAAVRGDNDVRSVAAFGSPSYPNKKTAYINSGYAFTVRLQHGYNREQIKTFAQAAYDQMSSHGDPDAEQTVVGWEGYNNFIQLYENSKNIIRVLHNYGFEIWVVSASSQPVVEVIVDALNEELNPGAEKIIPDNQVIGVRAHEENGVYTNKFRSIGRFLKEDDRGNNELITFDVGKLMWLNYEAFGIRGVRELERLTPIAFGMGDSDTDLGGILLPADYKMVLNRNKGMLMCLAYYNDASFGNWFITPMWIQPKSQKVDGYDCSEYFGDRYPVAEDTVFEF